MMKYRQRIPQQNILDPDEILVDSTSALPDAGILEGRLEKPLGRFSSAAFLVVIACGIGYLGIRAATLQIASGEGFFARSEENRFLTRPLIPPRGMIYDRFGNILARNTPAFSVFFEKEAFLFAHQREAAGRCAAGGGDDPGLSRKGGDDLALAHKGGNGGADPPVCAAGSSISLKERFGDTIAQLALLLKKEGDFFASGGFTEDARFEDLPATIEVMRDVPLELIAVIRANESTLPGIRITEGYRRDYAEAMANAHLLGFTGKVSVRDLARDSLLSHEDTVGKAGIEAQYDAILRGRKGRKIIEIDSRGVQTRFRMIENSSAGNSLRLAIDGPLQSHSYGTLERFGRGEHAASVVILDPSSGAVRAAVSFPGFDAAKFGSSIAQKEFDTLISDPLKPLFNRAIAGEYPSGSTIKPLFGAAALQEGIIDPSKEIYDKGFIEIPNPYRPGETAIFRDWKAHGWIDFKDAIARSANVYFYMIGGGYENQEGLGIGRLSHYARLFGLGSRLGIDIPGEKSGFFPDPETKKITDPKDPVWRIGDTYNVSIGQGGVKTTPLQITAITAAIANGGILWRPFVLEAVLDREGREATKAEPHAIRSGMIEGLHLDRVRNAMRSAVTEGTGRGLADVPMEVAAKTGTAQAGSGKPHAWVTAFAPIENPEIAITVMVEHAGEGSTVAIPITREILMWYYQNRYTK